MLAMKAPRLHVPPNIPYSSISRSAGQRTRRACYRDAVDTLTQVEIVPVIKFWRWPELAHFEKDIRRITPND